MSDEREIGEKLVSLRFAAEDGHLESMFLLGAAFATGKGVQQDHREAARWFHEASRRGHARSKASLGYLYSIGKGVRHDVVLGYIFISAAIEKGDILAIDMLVKLRRAMTPSQVMEAEKRMKDTRIG